MDCSLWMATQICSLPKILNPKVLREWIWPLPRDWARPFSPTSRAKGRTYSRKTRSSSAIASHRPVTPLRVAPQPPMGAFPFHSIQQQGIAASARKAITRLESAPTLGFWIHVDMDVLNTESMPAVDSPETGGMTPQELSTLLKAAVRSDRCVGMEITIYDPSLDPTGRGATLIVDMLAEVFSRDRREG